jgi:hypothetical protein
VLAVASSRSSLLAQEEAKEYKPFETDSKMAGRDAECDDASPDAVAKRLRDKIRLQAESLLSRCDESSSRHNLSRSASRDTLSRPSSALNVRVSLEEDGTVDVNEEANVVTPTVLSKAETGTSTTSDETSPSNNSTASSHIDLTKRIQRLALERQSRIRMEEDDKNRLRIIQSDTSSHLSSIKTFEELQLPEHLLNAVYTMGFNRPSAIQEAALPRIIAGRNVIGQAQSGSGKVRNMRPLVVCSEIHSLTPF